MTHSLIPWRLHEIEKNTIVANSENNGEVANTLNGFGDQKANAEFIIKAVNSHHEMLAVLRDVNNFFKETDVWDGCGLHVSVKNAIDKVLEN